MKKFACGLLVVVHLALMSCTGDLKGSTGASGNDATAIALISLKRPAFRSSTDGSTSKVVVQATTAKPAKVLIADTVYSNTDDTFCDLSKTDRNGLDTGSIAASSIYYLYAVPASSGTTFDLIASVTDPDTGPTGYADGSYLGSFFTLSDSTISTFTYAKGRLWAHRTFERVTNPANDLTSIKHTLKLPAHAQTVIGFAGREAQQAGSTYWSGADNTSNGFAAIINLSGITATGDSAARWTQVEIPLYDGSNIYIRNDNIGTELNSGVPYKAYWETAGWTEDPTDWK